MKYFAAFLIWLGIASVIWAIKQERTADLRYLPVVVIAGFGGAGVIIIGVVWIIAIAFMKA